MKFGKEIRDRALPGWEDHYMNYKRLKRILRAWEGTERSETASLASILSHDNDSSGNEDELEDPEAEFFFVLQRQLSKVNKFYLEEFSRITIRKMALDDWVNELRLSVAVGVNRETADHCVSVAAQLIEDMHNLQEFGHLNSEGFRKILKKLDKRIGTQHSPLVMPQVRASSFAKAGDALAPMRKSVEESRREVAIMLGRGSSLRLHKDSFRENSDDEAETPAEEDLAPTLIDSTLRAAIEADDQSLLRNQLNALPKTVRVHQLDAILQHACRRNKPRIITLCLQAGADPSIVTTGRTGNAFHFAVEHNAVEALSHLCQESQRGALDRGLILSNSNGLTPLTLACRLGRAGCVAVLCSFSGSLEVPSSDGTTPLMAAIKSRRIDAVRAVLTAGADPDSTVSRRDWTPLMLACRWKLSDVVETLLTFKADPQIRDPDGETALHKACEAGSLASVRLLLKNCPTLVNVRDRFERRTALVYAARGDHVEIARALIDAGAVVSPRDVMGWTPHTYAVFRGHVAMATLLQQAAHVAQKQNTDETSAGSTTSQPEATAAASEVTDSDSTTPPAEASAESSLVVEPPAVGDAVVPPAAAAASPSLANADVFPPNTEQVLPTRTLDSSTASTLASSFSMSSLSSAQVKQEPVRPVVTSCQPLDVTSFIDKEGPFRARGNEKTVELPQRDYGHDYLRDHCRVFVDIESVALRHRIEDRFGHALKPQQCNLVVVFSTESNDREVTQDYYRSEEEEKEKVNNFRARASVHLPITEDGDGVSFRTPLQVAECTHCRVEMRLVSVLDSTVILARGSSVALPWLTTDCEHAMHELELLDCNLSRVGRVTFQLLLVKPLRGHDMTVSRDKTYWIQRKSLPVWGHRGSGAHKASRVPDEALHRTHVQENTVLSFITAASLGAEYVEFDVQLTRDNVPIIYHNWVTSELSGYHMPIHMLTLEQFEQMKEARLYEDQQLVRQYHDPQRIVSSSNKIAESRLTDARPQTRFRRSHSNPEPVQFDATPFLRSGEDARRYVRAPNATLKEALRNVPLHLGFNIEVKYPLRESQDQWQMHQSDINTFLDAMLDVVMAHAGSRNIVFSSFHPDICRALTLKQPHYPVLFLTSAGFEERFDNRWTNSLRDAIRFAATYGLIGIVTYAEPIILCPELVRQVKAAGLLLLTWGRQNNNLEYCRLQEACGVDAVITDHVAHIRKGLLPRESASDAGST